jgi:hypothetical protein
MFGNSFPDIYGGQPAYDRVRGQIIPRTGPTLDILDEAFTSENWIVSPGAYTVLLELGCSSDQNS